MMELNRQLPADVTERRRMQNRIAQRRFRQRREQRQASGSQTTNAAPTNTSPSPKLNKKSLPPDGSSVVPFNHLTFDQTDTYLISPDFGNGDVWDFQLGENLLDSTDIPDSSSTTAISTPIFDPSTAPSTAKTSPDPLFRCSASDVIAGNGQAVSTSMILPPLQPPPPTSPCGNGGWLSALHIAALKGHDRIVRVLIEGNMDCNEKDSEGRTPLMLAVIENHEPVVTLLVTHGARSNEVDNLQRSVIHLAIIYRRENVLRAFLEACAERRKEIDIDGYDASGKTPLHLAVEGGFEAGVVILLRNGADMNAKARKSGNV